MQAELSIFFLRLLVKQKRKCYGNMEKKIPGTEQPEVFLHW